MIVKCEIKACGAERPRNEMRAVHQKGKKPRYRCKDHGLLSSVRPDYYRTKVKQYA